ncbi:MAG TPA: creatininase family protein [Tepidisphaeraceae bacterium]|nr:creatininase family protein [Tepidisphaeraceae bacterium]
MSSFTARSFVIHEANLRQLIELRPNVAVLPWGATEAHNYHLPHGTDVVEASALGERAVAIANERGARCVLLPCVPFGNNNMQLSQVATITMRTRTQSAALSDVAESLLRQGIDRLVVLNMHGGNDFRPLIRDVMLDLPIFITLIDGFRVAPQAMSLLAENSGDHANEFETSLMLHVTPQWVAPLDSAGDGAATPSELPAVTGTPGVWAPRDWAALTKDTGVGNPKAATAEKGQRILAMLVEAVVPVLVQLSCAKEGDFPFVIRRKST